MRTRRDHEAICCAACALAALALPLSLAAAELSHEEFLSLRGGYERGGLVLYAYPFEEYLTQTASEPLWWAYAGLSLDLEAGDWFRAVLRVAPGALTYGRDEGITLNGRRAVDELREHWAIRELFLEANLSGEAYSPLRLGKQEINLGRGLVYHDAGLGLSLDQQIAVLEVGTLRVSLVAAFPDGAFWDEHRDPTVRCDFELLPPCQETTLRTPTRRSWLGWAELRLVPSPFEALGLFAGVYGDRGNQFGRLAVPWIEEAVMLRVLAREARERPPQNEFEVLRREAMRQAAVLGVDGRIASSSGDLIFLGLQGNYLFDHLGVELTAVAQLGRFAVEIPATETQPVPRHLSPGVLSGALDLGLSVPAHELLSVGAFFTFLSGEATGPTGELQGEFNAFISVAPWILRSNLFFNSGLAHHFTARTASLPGLSGKGVLAGGLWLDLAPTQSLDLELTAAALGAAAPSSLTGGQYYGTEIDLEFHWYIMEFLSLAAEVDALFGGDFLQQRGTTVRALAGLDLAF